MQSYKLFLPQGNERYSEDSPYLHDRVAYKKT